MHKKKMSRIKWLVKLNTREDLMKVRSPPVELLQVSYTFQSWKNL